MAAMLLSQSFESPAAWKERSFRRSVFGVSSSVSASWFKLRTVLVGENSSSSKVRTVEAGETASAMIGRVGLDEVCLSQSSFLGLVSRAGPGSELRRLWGCWAHSGMARYVWADLFASVRKKRAA